MPSPLSAPPPAGKPHGPENLKGPASEPLASSKSPFEQMFERAGHPLTQKQLKQVIDQYLKEIINQMKKDDARWKKAMDDMKKVIQGNQ